ncbi:receptor-like protein 15 [Populus alba x Populus x berolinensis]|nr:receptor-like protein 15 [Populus alba x Populus x berolinensis]
MGLNRFSLPAVAVIMMINAMLLSQGCLEEERIALLQIKTSFGDHSNDNSWLLSWGKDALCCSWEGVTCSNSTTRRVVEIDLSSARYWYSPVSSMQYKGDLYLNASIFLPFQELNVLDLSGNGIAGCVANEGFERLSRLAKLESLSLSYNNSFLSINMKGLCELKHLQELDISYNHFTGSLPSCFSNLTNLQVLDISFNHFTGNTSLSSIGSLKSIRDLKLSDNHFQIPISLGPFFNLSNLKNLNGDRNEIYESTELVHNLIPRFQLQRLSLKCTGSGGTFPKSLYYQHDLQFVDLSHIKMTGEFPSWLLQNNTKLEELYLVNNSLSGSFQLANHSLVRLSHLDISRNRIHNQIPTEIGACFPRLVFLNLSRNDFDGSIPSSISNMSLLKVLDLSTNDLSGNIPEQLVEDCLSLEVIMLSNNYFKGQLFWKNFNLKYLTELILRGNQLIGILPNSLSNCSALEALDVSHNNLFGKIPRWIRNMSFLQYLDLSENNLFGSLPSSFCSSMMMTEVYLSKNKLEGSLIDAFDGCLSLNRLDLSHNYFRGKIPESIGSLVELSFLLLGYNNLEGEILSQLCKLEKLSLLDLSHNNLSGRILPCLHPTSEWYRKGERAPVPPTTVPIDAHTPLEDPSVNKSIEITTKSISYSFKGIILTYISGIDLSCNNLTGEIPFELGNLNNIQVLNLSHNSLTGPIPPTFSNLKEVETLDLSYNNLNGKIPPQLLNLNFLSAFSVAHNNLSGKTPEMVAQFSTFNKSVYEGNPSLCGPPLTTNCIGALPPSPVPRSKTHKKEENGVIDMEAFYVTFSVAYIMVLLAIGAVLYINSQWRQTWFYFIGESINNCYYFLVDNLPVPAREDFQSTGVGNLVTVGARDIQGEGFPDEYSGLADSVFLDLPQPWLAILSAGKMLKQDGTLCSFSPCIEQVQRTCEALKSNFRDIRTFEVLLRTFEVHEGKMDSCQGDEGLSVGSPPCKRRQRSSEGSTMQDRSSSPTIKARPCADARGHTGYLTFSRLKCLS